MDYEKGLCCSLWLFHTYDEFWIMWYIHRQISDIEDILPKGPYLPYVSIGG